MVGGTDEQEKLYVFDDDSCKVMLDTVNQAIVNCFASFNGHHHRRGPP